MKKTIAWADVIGFLSIVWATHPVREIPDSEFGFPIYIPILAWNIWLFWIGVSLLTMSLIAKLIRVYLGPQKNEERTHIETDGCSHADSGASASV